ncbi:MAG: DNA-directed RNA polymerase [Candidatus Heimdallarchaeota archaeon]|nr:DNA-directed RNA polymerase [Candidatus Heimdallarchaeota archaeon]
MYYLTRIRETVRVPPNRFGDRIEDVILDLSRSKNETTIGGDIGMIVAILNVNEISPGRIVPGDGATFHDVEYEALTFRPIDDEITEGEVVETTKFGFFMRIGCTDALAHISQISDEYFQMSSRASGVLVGRESGRTIRPGDLVRGKIITATVDHVSMKIAVTMKGEGLGLKNWLKEEQKA